MSYIKSTDPSRLLMTRLSMVALSVKAALAGQRQGSKS